MDHGMGDVDAGGPSVGQNATRALLQDWQQFCRLLMVGFVQVKSRG